MEGVAEKIPELCHFDERISNLSKKKQIISDFQRTHQIDWLRIDSSKLKLALNNILDKWIKK